MTTRQRRKRLQRKRKHQKEVMRKRQALRVRQIASKLLGNARAVLNLQSVTDVYGKVTFIELP